ncbi:DNA polymerase/3'-5' exonuclease PolX [Candidatus Parcubacteria bacterium]|nr:MAG: DNA polymerase/3'-5' exonuclease PolX [Candidatus Parcubacteria bacterium]
MASNGAVAKILSEIGIYLEMQGVPFKPRAYERAAEAVLGLEGDIQELYRSGGLKALEAMPGIGVSIAEKIEEMITTGRVKYYEELKKKTPVDIEGLQRVEGIGPKSIKKLYEKLGIRNLKDLETAARKGTIGKLAGFGKKTEDNILKGIGFIKTSSGRFSLGFAMQEIRSIEERLKNVHEVRRLTVAGSIRRRRETIGDVDILATSAHPKKVMDFFVGMPEVVRVYAKGGTKASVRMRSGIDIDLRVVPEGSYGAALNYFTGSKEHNVALRTLAEKKGMKLNEYGLFRGKKRVAGASEEEIYRALGLEYIEPEMREDKGEIELARSHKLPNLVGYGDLRGDLQIQTDWTDGSASIEAMAKAALSRGLEYIAITDHTKGLAMTGGLDEKKILKQMAEIDRVNKKLRGRIKVLKGTECDILKDGSLDLPDRVLARLDVVGVAVHSRFKMSRKEQTERIVRAISSRNVDILFHPTGRIIQQREPYDVDIDALIAAARRTGTILEIDAQPARLDLKDEHVKRCVEAGVKMSIDSDAHSPQHIEYLEYGIAQARRGWAERRDIVNAWPLEKMLQFLK